MAGVSGQRETKIDARLCWFISLLMPSFLRSIKHHGCSVDPLFVIQFITRYRSDDNGITIFASNESPQFLFCNRVLQFVKLQRLPANYQKYTQGTMENVEKEGSLETIFQSSSPNHGGLFFSFFYSLQGNPRIVVNSE